MKVLLLLLLAAPVFTGKNPKDNECKTQRCPKNEVFKKCRKTCPPQSCLSLIAEFNCVQPQPCEPGCDCIPGYLRNTSRTCINQTLCYPSDGCGPNEVKSDCKIECPPQSCESIYTDFACDPDQKCVSGCNCVNGYLRDKNGTCIPSEKCPTPEPVCAENEEYSTCVAALCRAQECSQKGLPIACAAVADPCTDSGCVCKKGYLRNEDKGCVPEDQCPQGCNNDRNATSGCGTYCGQRCSQRNQKNAICSDICLANGCACKKGFLYDDKATKKCVNPKDCSA